MRYKIWNKQDILYTPVGESFTAEEYITKHAGWANIPSIKCVIADMPINCSVFMEFEAMKEHYKRLGVNVTSEMSDQEALDSISEWEENPPTPMPSPEERTAAALEFQNLLSI